MTMNPVVHFEIPAQDRRRISDFYSKAFGWQTKQLGAEMGNYVLANSTETDSEGMPQRRAAINGGFYQKTDDMPAQYPSVVIAVDNLRESMEKVAQAGGKVLGEPMEIPGVGQYVSFFDSEGNRLSILEPTAENKAKDAELLRQDRQTSSARA
jgi:predicted enzyme related to lactoylglutathione lyase